MKERNPRPLGADDRQGVSEAAHAVLDVVDAERAPHVDPSDLLRQAQHHAGLARSGDLASRRTAAIRAAAQLILAVEAIDQEFI